MASDTDRTENGAGDGRTQPPKRPSVTRVEHFTVGRASRPRQGDASGGPARFTRRVGAGPAPAGPGRAARGAGADPRSGARSDPLRPHARLAVHVLSRRRLPDGLGSCGRPAHRAPHAALRRCPPVELRRLRRARPALVFSINDFDETLPGPFEWDVKRLVASFAVAGTRSRLRREAAGRDQPGGRPLVPREHPHGSPPCGTSTSGTRGSTSRICSPASGGDEGKDAKAESGSRRTSPRAGRRTA